MPNTNLTKLENMFNPQVVSDMLNATIEAKLRFTPIAHVNKDLEGNPGNTITVPKWGAIGGAVVVAEGEGIPVEKMSHTTQQTTVYKIGKAVSLSEEAILSGLGKPKDQAMKQLATSIATKIDDDVLGALDGAKFTLDNKGAVIDYNGIMDAIDLFNEEDDEDKVMYLAPHQITQLRKDERFIDKSKYGNDVMQTGEVGKIGGCRIVKSRKIKAQDGVFTNYIVQTTKNADELHAVTVYLKRDTSVKVKDGFDKETGLYNETYEVYATKHYAVALTNDAKVVKVQFKEDGTKAKTKGK